MASINLTINDIQISAEDGVTILDAAKSAGFEIPTLCFMKGLDSHANCRMCVVEVEGSRTLLPSCNTKIREGMVVKTDSKDVRTSRKKTLELLLARHSVDCHHCLRIGSSKAKDLDPVFCEMCFFCDCVRDGFCELQTLAREYEVGALPYNLEPYNYPEDRSTGCVVLNPNKCIKCLRCVDVCCDIQSVEALSTIKRGSEIQVVPAMELPLSETDCVMCGRCVDVCPTGATHILEQKDELLYHLHDYSTTAIAQVSDDVLDELAELFKMKRWQLDMGQVVAGLKKIGVNHVVTHKKALVAGENDAVEYIEKNAQNSKSPLIITSSNGAKLFVEKFFPELSKDLFCYDSAQQRFGKMVKERDFENIKSAPFEDKVISISITSNNDNEGDAVSNGSVDYVLNAREIYRIFLRCGVNLSKIHRIEPDENPLAEPVAKGMEDFFAPVVWAIDGEIEEVEVKAGGASLHGCVGKTLGHARKLLEEVEAGKSPYKIIKISS